MATIILSAEIFLIEKINPHGNLSENCNYARENSHSKKNFNIGLILHCTGNDEYLVLLTNSKNLEPCNISA